MLVLDRLYSCGGEGQFGFGLEPLFFDLRSGKRGVFSFYTLDFVWSLWHLMALCHKLVLWLVLLKEFLRVDFECIGY